MKRSRTPTTAWPAVADLMTILAVIGLSVAAVVERTQTPAELMAELQRRDSTIAALEQRIAEEEVGFFPCWRGSPGGGRAYFFAYDITYADGGYQLSTHRDFVPGAPFLEGIPADAVALLRSPPGGTVSETVFSRFAGSALDVIGNHYPANCRLAVTINRQATGEVIDAITRADLYPVYR